MNKKLLSVVAAAFIVTGCASVPMESKEASVKAKQFNRPTEGHSGLYVYRDSFVGQALKKDIWIDGKCIGESAPDVFFYEEVKSGQPHTISTESELILPTESGQSDQAIVDSSKASGATLLRVEWRR